MRRGMPLLPSLDSVGRGVGVEGGVRERVGRGVKECVSEAGVLHHGHGRQFSGGGRMRGEVVSANHDDVLILPVGVECLYYIISGGINGSR